MVILMSKETTMYISLMLKKRFTLSPEAEAAGYKIKDNPTK